MKLTKKKAKELCLIKWGYLKDTGTYSICDAEKKYPQLMGLVNSCGYCELYMLEGCGECPLYRAWGKRCNCKGCDDPYSNWCDAVNIEGRIKYATIIYNDIKRS